MITKLKNSLIQIRTKYSAVMQNYVDAPKEGRIAPQPNNELGATLIVKFLLGIK